MNNQNEDSIRNTPKTDIKYNKILTKSACTLRFQVKNSPQEKKIHGAIQNTKQVK
jgi:hypothetical protein